MKKQEIALISAVILTISISVILFFYNLYNYNFELKKTNTENTYILLRNGRYFEFLCQNDVIDNKVDFSVKPFDDFEITNTGNIFTHKLICSQVEKNLEKEVLFQRTANKITIEQKVTSDLQDLGRNPYYYTQIDYPLIANFTEKIDSIEIYDANCTTIIPKKITQRYFIVENSVRIGAKYSKDFKISIEMQIKCL